MDQNKRAFWLFVLVTFVVASIPSTMLLDAYQRYHQAVESAAPGGVLRSTRVRFVPHRGSSAGQPDLSLQFVEFQIDAAGAKAVDLVGDFNGWRSGTIKLNRKGRGWDVLIPLPKGRYRYLFLVDGQPRPDPNSSETEDWSGQKASVRLVR